MEAAVFKQLVLYPWQDIKYYLQKCNFMSSSSIMNNLDNLPHFMKKTL